MIGENNGLLRYCYVISTVFIKGRSMPPIIWALMLALLATGTANAQVYKCKSAKGVIVYSDTACAPGTQQSMPDIQSQAPATSIPADDNALTRQMDAAVKNAIAADDLIRARALATTDEQKAWVRATEKEAATRSAGGKDSTLAARADSAACKAAQRNLEAEAAGSRDPVTLNARTNLMRAACGLDAADAGSQSDYGRSLVYPYSSYPYGHHHRTPGYRPPVPGSGPVPPPAYDRYRYQPPFGSRYIRPEDGIYR